MDALPIEGRSDAYVAVSTNKWLHVLLEITQETFVEERRLNAIRVLTGDDFTVVNSKTGESLHRRFAMVSLHPSFPELASSFSVVTAALLVTLPPEPTSAQIVDFLDGVIELVAPKRVAAESTVVGLWGELWAIATSPDAESWGKAWHRSPTDRFDFSTREVRVEVKTSTGTVRKHNFSLDQVSNATDKPSFVASVTVVADPSGKSIIDLLEEIGARVSGALAAQINRLALQTLSGDIESAQDFAFAPAGEEPLLLFSAASIPRPIVPAGTAVSGVRFSADLTQVRPCATSLTDLATIAQG